MHDHLGSAENVMTTWGTGFIQLVQASGIHPWSWALCAMKPAAPDVVRTLMSAARALLAAPPWPGGLQSLRPKVK